MIGIPAAAQNQNAKLANEYYQQGEFDKALELYQDLDKNKSAIPLIHANYLQLLIEKESYNAAEKYLNRVMKYFPNNLQYKVDLAFFFHTTNKSDHFEKYIHNLQKQFGDNQYQLSALAQNFVARQLYDVGLLFYEKARKANGRFAAFALDMAAIHRLKNDKAAMTREYINYAEGNPANISYVKNLFQNILTEPEDQEYLEQTLIEKIQKNPEQTLYADLLIWLELQRKNFYAAFLQARALDRRNQQPGDESMRIARIAFDNKSWDDASDIFEYVIKTYPDSYNYATARRLLIRSQENKIKSEFPVDENAIRLLVQEYAALQQELGINPTTLEARRNQALLHAFYLDEMDTAIAILDFVISNRRSPKSLIAESKLDLGDIYLLTEQPWESTLLYSQVEKSHKESPLAYEAKLRNARLNYFTGNFALAKSHLDILKLATTRTISNDAIALSMLISDNTAFDSTDQVMQSFAFAELLIFRNQHEEARSVLNTILEENPGHSITDEIFWLQAKMDLQAGAYQQAIDKLDEIINGYGYDILSDDAHFQKGMIVQDYLKEDEQATAIFTDFLQKHPGSRHAAEARMRIRNMRGDLIN
ncbi:tetratricopeptide repeat protein [Marinoscillum furvescens]|nr:tetratricopeptide repeat protein [Marinoscillum furvescens]